MSLDVFVIVLAAAFLHASWNALAKSGKGDPLFDTALLAVASGIAAALALLVSGLPDPASSLYVFGSALFHVASFFLIGLAYRYADYSAVYPLVRGSAPLFTTLLAMLLLGETLQPLAWAGILMLCAGILALGIDGIRRSGLNKRSLA